jgi:D-amino-acid dehydrogenase
LRHDDRSARAELSTGEHIEADQIVLCAGFGSRAFLKDYGLRGTLMPMKGYSLTAPMGDAAPKISITDVTRKIVFCPLNGKMRVAGLAELGTQDISIDRKRLVDLTRSAQGSLPKAADFTTMNEGWAGIRPMTANSLPIIKRVRPCLAVNIGHGMLGWTYAMGSAERVSQLVMGDVE